MRGSLFICSGVRQEESHTGSACCTVCGAVFIKVPDCSFPLSAREASMKGAHRDSVAIWQHYIENMPGTALHESIVCFPHLSVHR